MQVPVLGQEKRSYSDEKDSFEEPSLGSAAAHPDQAKKVTQTSIVRGSYWVTMTTTRLEQIFLLLLSITYVSSKS